MNNYTTVIFKNGQPLTAIYPDGTRTVNDMHGGKGPLWHMPLLVNLQEKKCLPHLSTLAATNSQSKLRGVYNHSTILERKT